MERRKVFDTSLCTLGNRTGGSVNAVSMLDRQHNYRLKSKKVGPKRKQWDKPKFQVACVQGESCSTISMGRSRAMTIVIGNYWDESFDN